MATRVSCSWCGCLGSPGGVCAECAHQVGPPRSACRCDRCATGRQTVRATLRADFAALPSAAEVAAAFLAGGYPPDTFG